MRSHHRHAGAVLAVVHEPPGPRARSPLVFELCGLARTDAEALAARVAEHHRGYDVELTDAGPDGAGPDGAVPDGAVPDGSGRDGFVPDDVADGGPGRYLLRLTPGGPSVPGGPPVLSDPPAPGGPLTDDLLADLLAPLAASAVAVSGHQRELLAAAVDAQGGPRRYVEQIFWDWTGPLDLGRFTAAWQSVAEREAVLRASFDWAGAARLVLHDRAAVEVVRHAHAGTGWSELLRQDRARGFELYRPGLLRVSLSDTPQPADADADADAGTGVGGSDGDTTRLLVTYHRALLDERGARLLVRQFYRSYLAGGVLPGGDRRPDIRDHAQWLTRQDVAGARE
ncbi:hypothetical protein N4G66_44600, partial [Streptomyces rhizosphaerihabitans]|nr:hypothetical protein [Streptomyces rhizosphaerihabitans]